MVNLQQLLKLVAFVEVGPQIQWLFGLYPSRRQATISTLGNQIERLEIMLGHAALPADKTKQASVERSGANIKILENIGRLDSQGEC